MAVIAKFEVGKTYRGRFIGDSDLTVDYTVMKRTAKTVTVKEVGQPELKTRRIYTFMGVEGFRPYGNYSMALGIYADKDV